MLDYADLYRDVDFRRFPERYRIGRGEQGVLLAEPYKSEILPFWRFRTPEIAEESATRIYQMFLRYLEQEDFVGADMARKFLQMGFTRARRYANHPDGVKYDEKRRVKKQVQDALTNNKALSAQIFKKKYDLARTNEKYLKLKKLHQSRYSESLV